MNDTRRIIPATKASVLPALFICVSLILNVYLAVQLLNRKPAPTAVTETPDAFKPAGTEVSYDSLTNAAMPEAKESDVPAFHWSEVESTDYRQYIANLRAAGVSEQVIRDIIAADVGQHFNKRVGEILPLRVTAYWQKYPNNRPNPKQEEQLMALLKEHGSVLKELLGVRLGHQELIDTVFLQMQGSEQELLLLPPERREAAMSALADADFDSKEMKLHSQGSHSTPDEQKLFNEKLKSLAVVLTPEELDEYHLRNSPAGSILKAQTRYFNLTPEEYKQLLFEQESSGKSHLTKELVQKLFGDERAKEYERVSGQLYYNARTGADPEGIPLTQVDQAVQIADDTWKRGLAAVQDKTLSVEERKARMKEMQSKAEAKIKELLGNKASKPLIRDLNNYLHTYANTQP